MWSGRSLGDLELIALSKATDEVTGLQLGGFGHIPPVINSRGDVAFKSGSSNSRAWIHRDGQLRLLALYGQVAPGITPARTFNGFGGILLNDNGKTIFNSSTRADDGTSAGTGTWEYEDGELRPVVVPGMNAPLQDGRVFSSTWGPSTNEAGQIAFNAWVTDVVGDGLTRGVFAEDIHGDLRVIALSGEELNIGDGDTRTISQLYNATVNDLGHVLFEAHFTDGSIGFFVSDAVAIPEPSSLMLMVSALCIAALGRRRRRLLRRGKPRPTG